MRRTVTEEYLGAINWDDPQIYQRVIPVFQRLLATVRPSGGATTPQWGTFLDLMDADGWLVSETGRVTPKNDPLVLAPESVAALKDASALHEQMERLRRAASAEDRLALSGPPKSWSRQLRRSCWVSSGRHTTRTGSSPS